MSHSYRSLAEIPPSIPLPQVICLDAVGTLFGVRGSVGEIYSRVASKYGVNCPAEVLNKHFYAAFKNSPPCIFPGCNPVEIPQQEYLWWREINRQTFTAAGTWEQFADFDAFFQELYCYFTTAEAWEIYLDVVAALVNWQRSGIELAVLSNFDSRLHLVLNALDLHQYFSSVTISTAVGAAKPQPEIFAAALAQYQCPPQAAWHIGDSWDEDYLGASQAGLTAIWLNRE